jgi:hypothetical protein
MVGFGAGSSHFNALVKINDSETKNNFGSIFIDKDSWVLGWGFAASQTVEVFMQNSAIDIAKKISSAKMGKPVLN